MKDASSTALLSAAVVWEVALKRSLGKLGAPTDLVAVMLSAGAQALPVTIEHAEAVGALPWHHRDRSTASSSPRRWSRARPS